MKQIDRNNIEAWLLDFHEGRLNSDEKQALHDFLSINSDIPIDPYFADFIELPTPELTFPCKGDLFRTEFSLADISEEDLECIARHEGDLEGLARTTFDTDLMENQGKALRFSQFGKTKLQPDPAIVFEGKEAMKKSLFMIPAYIYGAIATAAVLIISLIVFRPDSQTLPESGLVAQDSARNVIYLNKLKHPSEYDHLAVVEPSPILQKQKINQTIETEIERDIETITFSGRLNPGLIATTLDPAKNFEEAFVYRIDPYISNDEYKTFLAFSGDMVRKNILGQDPEMVRKTRFSFWELADAGLEKVSGVLNLPVNIDREYNIEGELVEVSFDSKLLAFSTPIHSRKTQ